MATQPEATIERPRDDLEGVEPTSSQVALRDRAVLRRTGNHSATLLLVILAAILCLPPLYFVFQAALADGAAGLRAMVDEPTFPRTLRITLALALGSAVVSVIAGTFLAWCAQGLSRRTAWLGALPLVPLILPPLATVTGYEFLFSPRIGYGNVIIRNVLPFLNPDEGPFDVNSVAWMIVVTSASLTSLVYLFIRSAMTQLGQDVVDAAGASGATPTRSFVLIVLPLLRPALVYASMTVTLLALGQFTVPLFLGRQENLNVLSTAMYINMNTFPPNVPLAAAYGFPIVATGIIFIIWQRILLRDQNRFVTTSGKGVARQVTRRGLVAPISLCLYGFFAVVAPIAALVVVSLQPFWSAHVVPSDFTFDNFREVLDTPRLVDAIGNSLLYAVLTTAVVLPLGFACARVLMRRRGSKIFANALDLFVSLSLGIPAVIFGIGFLLAYTRGPLNLYAKDSGLILVYVVLLLPFVTRILLSSMVNIGASPADAGAASGASLFRRLVAIELPMLRPALASAAAIVVIITSHEFSASILVRASDTEVMGTVLYDVWFNGNTSQAAVMSLLMCVVTGLGVALALLLAAGRRRS